MPFHVHVDKCMVKSVLYQILNGKLILVSVLTGICLPVHFKVRKLIADERFVEEGRSTREKALVSLGRCGLTISWPSTYLFVEKQL